MTEETTSPAIDVSLVRHLLAVQFPHWAELPVRPIRPSGWDNRTFRLGDDMLVRLPSAEPYAGQVEKEQYWLPKLAAKLPLAIPSPLALGHPALGYPWHWSVYRWIEGEPATTARIDDMTAFGGDLARFMAALHAVDASEGPAAGRHNFHRGGLLSTYDVETRRAIAKLGGKAETEAATAIWETAIATTWRKRPAWVHGDLAPGNLLVNDGHLCAVIDFGNLGVGDFACDLAIAWTFLSDDCRTVFDTALSLDAADWARGRGWALWKALISLTRNVDGPAIDADEAQLVFERVLIDRGASC